MTSVLEQLQRNQVIAQEAADKEVARINAEGAKVAASKTKLDQIISQEFEKGFLLNNFNGKLTQAYLATQENPLLSTLGIYDKALRNPLLGLTRTATGFHYNGNDYGSLSELSTAMENTILGTDLESQINDRMFAVLITEVLTKPESHLGLVRAAGNVKAYDTADLTPDHTMTLVSLGLGGF